MSVTAQTHAADRTRMNSPFVAQEYNPVNNQYRILNTTLLFEDQHESEDIVWVHGDFIIPSQLTFQLGGIERLRLKEKHLSAHIEVFEKFLEWETLASKDGDIFTKKISKTNKNKYTFHSKNASEHYLVAQTCLLGCYAPYYFDRENAERALKFLRKWQAGELSVQSSEEIDDKYK